MNTISLQDVWLKYRLDFKENGKVISEDFWALKEINLNIQRGEIIGIIGENGAGKTSLLKIIAAMLKADKGNVKVNGTVSTLMEISAGFQRDLTGKENIYLISSLFGLAKVLIDSRYNDIINLASIGRFINTPVKNYSQGMYMRLAFAIAIHVDPDILLIDDIFAVGDIYAQRKCINKMFELKEKGMTILFALQDLEMLKRICSRAIFLRAGVIVKDGHTDTVCSYYTETVGDRKGIALAQQGFLGAVFNNGRLILRWKDKTITTGLSGHSLMVSSARQYLSNTADWEIQESKVKNEIIAIGKWEDFSVSQSWRISFLSDKEFVWEITIYISESVHIEKIQTAIFFADVYKSWFDLSAEKKFPKTFIHYTNRECTVIDGHYDKIVGIKSTEKVTGHYPAIVLDKMHGNAMGCQIGNTGSDIHGRVISYDVHKTNYNTKDFYKVFLCKIKIFDNGDSELSDYIDQMKKLTLISKDSMSMGCKDKKIEIYWQGKLLTRGSGLFTRFMCQGSEYSSAKGTWSICTKNDREILVTITWGEEIPLRQIWKLKLQDSNAILWEVEMEIDEQVKIRCKRAEIILSEDYGIWFTPAEKGNFKKVDKKHNAVILNSYMNQYIGVKGARAKDSTILPGLKLNPEDMITRVSYISKVKESSGVSLLYAEIDYKENFWSLPGKSAYFRGVIKITPISEEGTRIEHSDKSINILNNHPEDNELLEYGNVSLTFDSGRCRLFWKGIELTKGLCFYTSILFEDNWYDSSQAFWKLDSFDKTKLVAVGYWPIIPLIQTWEIALSSGQIIEWKIKKEVWEDIVFEREQVNIMFTDKYKEWLVHKKAHGKFPEKFLENNGLSWDKLWCQGSALPIGMRKNKIKNFLFIKKHIPNIVFSCSKDCKARYSVIENTDNLFKARVLQYEMDTKKTDTPEYNRYFEGQIKITT